MLDRNISARAQRVPPSPVEYHSVVCTALRGRGLGFRVWGLGLRPFGEMDFMAILLWRWARSIFYLLEEDFNERATERSVKSVFKIN